MTQAIPQGVLMSMRCPRPPIACQSWLTNPLGRADEGPGQGAHERRHVVRHRHELLERRAARHVGAREDPPHDEADDDSEDGRHPATSSVLPKMWA